MLNTVTQTNDVIHSVDHPEKIRITENDQIPPKRIRKRIKYTGPYTALNRFKSQPLQSVKVLFTKSVS